MRKITILFIFSLIIASGCSLITNNENKEKVDQESEFSQKVLTETLVFKNRCNTSSIQKLIDEGWIIEDTETQEVPCSWKKTRSRPKCKPNKDKGCLITVPETYGKLIIYKLKRERPDN